VSQNIYIGVSPNLKQLLNNDYVETIVTFTVPVMTSLVSANAVATLNITGAVTKTVTFNPSASTNYVLVPLTLPVGVDTLYFVAVDWTDSLSTPITRNIRVAAASDAVACSQILPYPAPYNPDAGLLRVQYELNKSAAVDMYIYNLAGKLINKVSCPASTVGFGVNEVTLAGVDAFGQTWSNGLYVLRLVSDKRVIGTCKLLVIR
jgi:hypothetical protein